VFRAENRFEGCGDLEITEEMKVCRNRSVCFDIDDDEAHGIISSVRA
jgi:hypothetical protein